MSIDVKGICKIIETCGKQGVKNIKFEGVEIDFGTAPEPQENIVHTPFHPSFTTSPVEEDAIPFNEEDKEVLIEEDYSTLLLDEPEKYEELLAMGKLESYGEAHAESE